MARYERRTAPLHSKFGLLETYDDQKPHLIEAEWRGRRWAYAQAATRQALTDTAILDMHEAMFAPLLEWAGRPRSEDVGPGGKVSVPFPRVREELRKLADDFGAQWSAASAADADPTLEDLANLLADTHHRFQWIHPFLDTNGRTGRVLDHFILWSAFGLAGGSLETSPVIVYFPHEEDKHEYYEGLVEADLHRPDRLRTYYARRLQESLEAR